MKKLLFLLMTFTSMSAFSQNLSLTELISLRKMSLEDTETFLTNKGWQFKDVEEPTYDRLGRVTFLYGTTGDYEYAESFVYKYYKLLHEGRIVVQISSLTKYMQYLNSVKAFKPLLIFSGSDNGDLIKVYQGTTTTFIFRTSKSTNRLGDAVSSWSLGLWTNDDYNITLPFN